MTQARAFAVEFEALPEIVAFTAAYFEARDIDRGLLTIVDFVLEELFTNVVKYGRGSMDAAVTVQIDLRAITGGIEVSLIADGVADFDVTRVPEADTSLPLDERRPGGLGLQLSRQLVDSIEYQYQVSQMRSRVTFRKTSA